jgi:hypothetical protein
LTGPTYPTGSPHVPSALLPRLPPGPRGLRARQPLFGYLRGLLPLLGLSPLLSSPFPSGPPPAPAPRGRMRKTRENERNERNERNEKNERKRGKRGKREKNESKTRKTNGVGISLLRKGLTPSLFYVFISRYAYI